MTLLISVFCSLVLLVLGVRYLTKINQQRASLKKLHELAIERGGKCLSEKYVSSAMKLKWECAEGHVWEATPNSINRGRWCPECLGIKRLTIEGMQEIAAELGGRCLSDKYENSTTMLRWECREGHIWEETPDVIMHGNWCPECARAKLLTIEGMQEIAFERGGKCLSDTYINSTTKLTWECSKGHTWEASPQSIRRGGWCPDCLGSKRLTIEEMHELAAERGGKCLSDKYVSLSTKVRWECREGHIWEATTDSIKRGAWCPECLE